MKYLIGRLGLLALMLAGTPVLSQTPQNLFRHNWHFGNTTSAIRFNRVTNIPTITNTKAIPFGDGGSAVATDRENGNVLFYTDGENVYGINNVLMPNGNNLSGNPAGNQPAAITPVPGQPGKFFIFTNNASFTTGGAISVTVVDMASFGSAAFPSPPFGDVDPARKNQPTGLLNRAEGMITVPHANRRDFWLITQSVNSQTFEATLISPASYTSGTFTTTSSNAANLPTTAAHLAYHQGLRKIAVSPQDPSTDAIILNFNDGTGIITFDRTIFNTGLPSTTNQMIFDIEWSPTGRFLYISRHGEPGITADLLQYDYFNTAITLASVLPAPVFRSYGVQSAPDNRLYHLYQATSGGNFLLGRINSPDSVAADVNYDPAPLGAQNFAARQFPGFLPIDTIAQVLSFTFAGTCENSPTSFFPNARPGADSITWSFGDGSSGAGFGPLHTYDNPGAFNVTMRAHYGTQVDSATRTVQINPFPLQVQLVADTTACRDEFPPPRGTATPANQFSVTANISGGSPTSIVWSNGDTGATLTPDSAGYYYVVVTDASGCSAYAGVNVREYRLEDQIFNKWYFGDNAGIDFSATPPQALDESAMTAPEGCAIVCDRNGQQIMYTDGSTVFDKKHNVIATSVGGSTSSTQSAIIVNVPGDETLYYIFTTQAINGTDSLKLQYTLFDLKQNNGDGAVVKQNVFMYLRSTERLTASPQWLISHEYGNNTFRAYPITTDGIGNPVFSSIGSDHSFTSQANGEGYMKLGPRNNLAVPISTPGTSNTIELFTFIDTTGVITNLRTITLPQANGQIYGVEFSPGGNKLFATLQNGGGSELFEYSIDSLGNPHFKQQLPVAGRAGAIQTGPDGQVYVAIENSTNLGAIIVNEDTTGLSSYNTTGFALLGGTQSRLGLPNFVQANISALGGPGILVTGLCLGDSTRFTGTPTDQIDEFDWQVSQGAAVVGTSQDADFSLLLALPGNYTATLRLTNRCGLDTTMVENFTITRPPADPSMGAVLCNGPVTLDANPTNVAGLTYLWSTGETTETFVMDEQGTKFVDITDALGCTTTGQFLVGDLRPDFDLGPDITICEDNNTPALNAGNHGTGTTYQWRIDGANASTIATQAVDTSLPGVFTYEVTVTEPAFGCVRTEDKVYTVRVSPAFNFTSTNTTACGTNTGSVTLQMNTSAPPGGPLYQYLITGPGPTSQAGIDQAVPNTVTVPNLGAGTYSVAVIDQISGCTISSAVAVSDPSVFTITPTPTGVCEPVVYSVATTAPATPASPLSYTITNNATGQVTGPTNSPTSNFTTPGLLAGDYVLQVRDNTGCINAINPLTVTTGAPATVTITPDLCALTLTASGQGTVSPVWSSTPPTAITGPTTGVTTINLTPNAGAVTYTYTGTAPGFCPVTQTINLNVGNTPTPVLAQSTACAPTVTLTATPNGAFTYQWSRNGTPDPTLGGNQVLLTLADDGDSFNVTLLEPQSGCTRTSQPLTASVVGTVDAQLSSTPPCQDGQPFTLTATTVATGVSYSWFRNNGALAGVTTATTAQTDEGSYRVEVRKASCLATATLDITRAPLPEGELPNRVIICNDPDNTDPTTRSIDLDPGLFQAYEWSKNQVLLNNNARVFNADSEGLYEVRLTNGFNCVAVDETEVLSECAPRINAPNVFKPGSKVLNDLQTDLSNSDFWVITKFIEDDDFQIFIFNRWGEMVFNSTNRFFKWNGGYNNNAAQPLPPGTYSYVIKYVSSFRPEQGVQEKRGGVALLR